MNVYIHAIYMIRSFKYWNAARYILTLSITYGVAIFFLNSFPYTGFSGFIYGLELCSALIVSTIFLYNKRYNESGIVTITLGLAIFTIIILIFNTGLHITSSSNLISLAVWSGSITFGGILSILYMYWHQIVTKLNPTR